jgi:hypothetical protein
LIKPECRLADGTGFAHEGDHRTVGGLSGIDIQQAHTFNGLHHGGDGIDLGTVAALADVGHTFDQLALHGRFNG